MANEPERTKERDEWEEECDDARAGRDKAERERDEARAEVARLQLELNAAHAGGEELNAGRSLGRWG